MDIHANTVNIYVRDRDSQTLNQILALLRAQGIAIHAIQLTEEQQMADLTALENEVAENGDAVDSAVTLLGGLAQALRDAATDPAAVQALADQLDSQTHALADAVVANTPASTEPPVEPPVEEPPA